MRSRVVLLVIALLSVSPTPSSEQADGETGAGYEDGYVFAGYESHPVSVTHVTNRPHAPTRWCVHWPMNLAAVVGDVRSRPPEEVRALSQAYRGPLVEGGFYLLICYRADEQQPYHSAISIYHRRDPTEGVITTIETVSEFARELVTAPAPAIATSPPPDRLVVGFEVWLATPHPYDAPVRFAQAGHLWARAEPVPVAITYGFGDGTTLRCDGPPPPAEPGIRANERPDCARHTYLDSRSDTGVGTFTIRATVTYDVWLTTSEDPTPRRVDSIDGATSEKQ